MMTLTLISIDNITSGILTVDYCKGKHPVTVPLELSSARLLRYLVLQPKVPKGTVPSHCVKFRMINTMVKILNQFLEMRG